MQPAKHKTSAGVTPKQERSRAGRKGREQLAGAVPGCARKAGIVSAACKSAGVSRSLVYKTRDDDEKFAASWEAACDDACDTLEAVAVRRAVEHSDQLLMFLLKARRPEKFSDRTRHELEAMHFKVSPAGQHGTPITLERLVELAGAFVGRLPVKSCP